MLGEFLKRTVTVKGKSIGYQVYQAPNLPAQPPVILFLHGAGETGDDNEKQTVVGIGKAIRENPDRWPFLVVFPQKPTMDLWPEHRELVEAILKAVEIEFKPSVGKRFITGLSQGGNGTLTLPGTLRWKFVAAVPICGWADPCDAASRLKEIPTWLFHGEADGTVPVSSTHAVADWMKRMGNTYKTTFYPGVDHNSWDNAYAEAVPEWFLEHSRGDSLH
jgi:predicted peptidase